MTDEPYADSGVGDLGGDLVSAFEDFCNRWQVALADYRVSLSAPLEAYRGRRAGWYPRRPRRAPRGAQRRHEASYEGRAGDFAPSCLNCGVGQMDAASGYFHCRTCGTTSGAN